MWLDKQPPHPIVEKCIFVGKPLKKYGEFHFLLKYTSLSFWRPTIYSRIHFTWNDTWTVSNLISDSLTSMAMSIL